LKNHRHSQLLLGNVVNFPRVSSLSANVAPLGEQGLITPLRLTVAASLWLLAAAASAQGHAPAPARPPDAGLLQNDKLPAPPPQRPHEITRPVDGRLTQGGAPRAARAVSIQRVVVEGSTVISQEEWDQRFADVGENLLTLVQMRELAALVQAIVQQAGRPFAVAYLPPQDLSTEELIIRVVEGQYGQVHAAGSLAGEASSWLEPLRPGQPIGSELERQMLLLSELPGVASTATLSPGAQPGEADLSVQVDAARGWGGEIRVDNHGNRYAGRHRVVGAVYFDRLWLLGDRISMTAGTGDEGGGQGAVSYALPLGSRGVRLNVSGAVSQYELGKEFDILGASGKVTSVSAMLSVPLVVTSRQRVGWESSLQAQRISNRQALFETEDRRSNLAWINSLQASQWLPGGGALWGRVSAEAGRVRLEDDFSQQVDALSARTAGTYLLLSVDATAQKPFGDWSLYGHLNGQLADRNLDPSKKFVLGGPSGVRAWPTSEGAGDDGALVQVEVRRDLGMAQPFAFLDAGRVQFSHQPWFDTRNTRSLAGAGVGVRMAQGPWQLQGTAGWRIGPGRDTPESDPRAKAVQLWLSLGYRL